MILELKAKHFKNTDYISHDSCAIEKAYTELIGSDCSEGVIILRDRSINICYNHEYYGNDEFESDKQKAISLNFDDTVIRTIELIKQ